MDKVYSHFTNAREYMFSADYEQAEKHLAMAVKWSEDNLPEYSIHYRICQSYRFYCLYKINKYQEAINLAQPFIDYYVDHNWGFDIMVNKAIYVIEKSQLKLQ